MKPREQTAPISPTDIELVQKIASGDLEALGLFFDRHEGEVRRTLNRLGITPSDLDDVLQGTFLQVIRAAPGFDPTFSAKNWLLGIAAMMARRHHRSLRRTTDRLTSWMKWGPSSTPVTPGEALDALEAEQRVKAALARLSPKRREAFVLVTLEGASGDEAARALGIPLNTLWTRLHHARNDLRAWLLVEDP